MGKRSNDRAKKKHTKALKRRARLAARPGKRPAGTGADELQALRDLLRRPANHVWDPSTPRWGLAPPPLPAPPDAAARWWAAPYREGWVALHHRRDDGETELPPLYEIPLATPVAWAGDPVVLEPPDGGHVGWAREPELVGDVVRGAVAVHALVDGGDGLRWGPVVPFEIRREGRRGVLDAGILGGALTDEGVEVTWGDDEPHEIAVAEFLQRFGDVLWRVFEGGPGIDTECRIRALRGDAMVYRRWAVDAVVAHADDDVPGLLRLLRAVGGDVPDPLDEGPLHAMVILAHLGVVEAHPLLLRLARLPNRWLYGQVGDFVTEGFAATLLRTSGGELGGIRALFEDPTVDEWVRSVAADALSAAVEVGMAPRAEVVERMAAVLASPDGFAERGSPVYSAVVNVLEDQRALEWEDRMLEALTSGLVNPSDMSADDVREGLRGARAGADCLRFARTPDVHLWIGRWAG